MIDLVIENLIGDRERLVYGLIENCGVYAFKPGPGKYKGKNNEITFGKFDETGKCTHQFSHMFWSVYKPGGKVEPEVNAIEILTLFINILLMYMSETEAHAMMNDYIETEYRVDDEVGTVEGMIETLGSSSGGARFEETVGKFFAEAIAPHLQKPKFRLAIKQVAYNGKFHSNFSDIESSEIPVEETQIGLQAMDEVVHKQFLAGGVKAAQTPKGKAPKKGGTAENIPNSKAPSDEMESDNDESVSLDDM